MYCSSCGTSVAEGLSYCNHCGAKVRKTTAESGGKQEDTFPESLVWAIAAVFIVGIGSIIGLMAVMKQALHFDNSVILAVTLLSFLLMFVVEGAFLWLLLSRRRNVAKKTDDAERLKEQTTRELDAAQARALPEHMPSVTEQTTRTFEPVYRERSLSKE
jgi:predicted amidophosphoribosyltransferase